MTYQDLETLAASTGLETAYYQFENDTGRKPPFLVWHIPNNNDVFADNVNYTEVPHVVFELYTPHKDFDLERTVEELLYAADLSYTKTESDIEAERMHLTIYEFETVITR